MGGGQGVGGQGGGVGEGARTGTQITHVKDNAENFF